VYARLCKAINKALGKKIIPDPRCTLPAEVPFFKQRTSANTDEHYECRSRIVDRMASYRLIRPSLPPTIAIANQTTQYILPTLVKETYIPDDTSLFKDRRLTALPDGRLALVPASTKAGDHILCLAGSKVPYVLRPYNEASQMLDAEIRDAFPKSGDFKSWSTRGCMACQNDLVSFHPKFRSWLPY
jgi:hypothetical protein